MINRAALCRRLPAGSKPIRRKGVIWAAGEPGRARREEPRRNKNNARQVGGSERIQATLFALGHVAVAIGCR